MAKPLEKFERKFGKIESEYHAKELIDKLKLELIRRKQDLLREFERSLVVEKENPKRKDSRIVFKIPRSNGKYFAILKGFFTHDNYFHISLISVGELEVEGHESHFKLRDSFRGLDISPLLMNRVIKFARMNGLKGITLECNFRLIPFYEKFGFVLNTEEMNEYVPMILNFK